MKCSACTNGDCKGDYDLRNHCVGEEEGIDCKCYCHETAAERTIKSTLSIAGGVAGVAGNIITRNEDNNLWKNPGGVALTIMSGGLFGLTCGSVLLGACSSMITNPVEKIVKSEHMENADYAKDLIVGATIGAVTAPIGNFYSK